MVKEGDIFGDGVNIAARLEGLVKGGEICVSRGVRDHLRHRGGMLFEDLGEQLVKNIAHPIRAFRLRTEAELASVVDTSGPAEAPLSSPMISDLSAETEVALELAFWESVKDGSPAELKSYLERYPDGTFAPLAKTRLAAGSAEPPNDADPAVDTLDLAFWDSVKDSNRREEYEAYLEQHPNGHFASLARARLSSPEVN